jgi:hypothetical protein
MIAYDPQRSPEPPPRGAGSRAGRSAAERRRGRTAVLRHRAVLRTVAVLSIATLAVVAYLASMANVTRLNFELTRAARDRVALLGETTRLDDKLASLESRDRLELIAAGLGMRDPATFAVAVVRPQPVEKPSGLAFFPSVAHWLR